MESGATLALIAVALAYAFDFANGFHHTANAVATIVYTKANRAFGHKAEQQAKVLKCWQATHRARTDKLTC